MRRVQEPPAARRADRARLAAAGSGQQGWRSHTFADGVQCLTLVGSLDACTADRIRARISELASGGVRRLIVDARAVDPGGDRPALLASVFAERPVSHHVIVVAARGSALVDHLPFAVGVARSLTDAHRRLAAGEARTRAPRRQPLAWAPSAPTFASMQSSSSR